MACSLLIIYLCGLAVNIVKKDKEWIMPDTMKEILEFNKKFVENKEYEKHHSGKLPEKKLAILACMDTRFTRLLPAALNLNNGDVKLIKNAGALVSSPFGGIMRSLLVCVYEMGVDEVAVIGHYGCGMKGFNPEAFYKKMLERGIPQERIDTLKSYGIPLDNWLRGFDDSETSVRETVKIIKNHPLIPEGIRVTGWLMDPETGRLDAVVYDTSN